MHTPTRLAIVALLTACPALAGDGLRVATWNISNYAGGRVDAIHTSVYGQFEGRSMAPDAMIVQEMLSASALQQLTGALNSAPGSPGDWAAAPFIDGNDTDNGFVYRTSRVILLDTVVVAQGGLPPNHPRDVVRYDVRPVGYASEPATISLYSSHMKAGSAGDDQTRRLLEAQRIRADADALPVGRQFILGGDFNIQSSAQQAYVELTRAGASGRFRDPINTPGSWNNSGSFRFVHTQDPAGAGGMDDRHDQLLVSYGLTDLDGTEYIGDASIPYATFTWDDANHSYRAWGNDGSSFNLSLTTAGNTMVGPQIAQALITMCAGAGHLPVFLDLRVPARVNADGVVDFGIVTAGQLANAMVGVANGGDVGLWGAAGIDTLDYALDVPAPFDVAAGPFSAGAGDGANTHEVTLLAGQAGYLETTLLITTNAPDSPTVAVPVRANVLNACPADWNEDGELDPLDFLAYLNDWTPDDPHADLDWSGEVDVFDFILFLNAWNAGC